MSPHEADLRRVAASMREAAAKVAEKWERGEDAALMIRALPLDTDAPPAPMPPCYYGGHWCEHKRTQELGTALVCLDCGKQQDAGTNTGEEKTQCRMCGYPLEVHELAAQADAIKAAVAAANNRAADAFRAWRRDALERSPIGELDGEQFEAWLRSGEDALGAVTPAKGGE